MSPDQNAKATEANGHRPDDRFFDSLHRRPDASANASTLDAREVLARMAKGDINDKVFEGFVGHLFKSHSGRDDFEMTPEREAVVTKLRQKIGAAVGEELFVHGPDKASELIASTALAAVICDLNSVYPDFIAKIVPNLVIGDLLGLGKR